jgi:hypothetical protein
MIVRNSPKHCQHSIRTHGTALLMGLFLCTLASRPVLAFEKPEFAPSQAAAEIMPSQVSAVLQFSMASLAAELDRQVPKRLATFNERAARCWHKHLLGMEVNIDCVYTGFIERTGPVALRAEGDSLTASVPLFGTVSGQGTHRLAGLLHGAAKGRMNVYVESRPKLNADWSVDLKINESYRWTEPPILNILGFQIGLARFADPKIHEELHRAEAAAKAKIKALDLRKKIETAWRRAFEPVKLADQPEVWLQLTPRNIAFAGLHAHADFLEGAVEIKGTAESVLGSRPSGREPPPLPQLENKVEAPGKLEFAAPLRISYTTIKQKLQEVIATNAKLVQLVHDVDVYPSKGKLVVGLRLAIPAKQPDGGEWVYLEAEPQLDAEKKVVRLASLALTRAGETHSLTEPNPLADNRLDEILRQHASVAYGAEYEKLLASASAALTRNLGDGFRSEGMITSGRAEKILLLSDGLRIDLHAIGALKIIYAP